MTTNLIKNPTQRKSILDMSDFELAQIDNYQNANRGFTDNSEPALENYYNHVDAYLQAQQRLNELCLGKEMSHV